MMINGGIMVKFNYRKYFYREIMKNIIIYVKDDHNKKNLMILLSCHVRLATFNVFFKKINERDQ